MKFFRFDLRTTNVASARAFYRTILGHDCATIWPLHEQALARGARPHWLGYIGVDGVDGVDVALAALLARGAAQLGPAPVSEDGARAVVVRDPGGAIVAIATTPRSSDAPRADVGWHILNTNDAARATSTYAELFGWEIAAPVDVGGFPFYPFAWSSGGERVGAMGDVANRHGVHAHWLFFFTVDAFDAALDAVRAAGGVIVEVRALPSGGRVGVCDDPQGAAFGLRERAS